MTPEEKKAEVLRLAAMRAAGEVFYGAAARIGVHRFLEIAGFINEMIRMYEAALDRGEGLDEPLRAKPHEMAYVAEKLECMFGEALADPESRRAFFVALAEKGGFDEPINDPGLVEVLRGRQWLSDKEAALVDRVTHARTCGQAGCSDPARFTFVWPGKARAPICLDHVAPLVNIAAGVGIARDALDLKPIEDDGRRHCIYCGRAEPEYINDPTCPKSTETSAHVYCHYEGP